MTLGDFRRFLAWCCLINYIVLIVWFVVFVFAHDPLYRLHSSLFTKLSPELFDTLHYGGMTVYKIGVLLFNLVPLIALWILDRRNQQS